MGWWSPTILGGDDPLDELSSILEKAGFEKQLNQGNWIWEEHPVQVRRALTRINEQEWLDMWRQEKNKHTRGIFLQVLAVVYLGSGAPLPEDLKEKTLQALEDENISTWRHPEERRAHLDALADLIKNAQPRRPVFPPSEGLFDVMAEAFSPPVSPSSSSFKSTTVRRSKKKP